MQRLAEASGSMPYRRNRETDGRMKFSHITAMVKVILIAVPILLATLYGVDYLWFRIRVSHPQAGPSLGTVRFFLATPIKGGREEIFFDQPQTETCARSLFPHLGHNPCWYSGRRTVRVIR